eukprot:Skav200933  [mRNA]  locus=scaffold2433:377025:382227:+ [translate_table: standard]
MLWFFMFLSTCSATPQPFAEHFVPSAAPLGDCDFQSGALGFGHEPWCDSLRKDSHMNFRVGEASHPGPYHNVVLGCSNPGGLRSKECLAIGQGPGIWTFSETQLSMYTQRSAARALRVAAQADGRHIRALFGAPAPLRPRSLWAGGWTGVCSVSDFPAKVVQIEWPPDVWESGRVLATQHYVGPQVLTVISLYGLPRGPTWPQAAQLMNEILGFITKTFIFGHSGHVAIQGDFNFSPHELDHFHLWKSLGWIDAQTLAENRWQQERKPTCKGSTERDLIWLSPSLASICTQVQVEDVFADHSSVSVVLELAEDSTCYWTWPRPSLIPWDRVDCSGWHESCSHLQFVAPEDSTQFLQAFSHSFESSLEGHVQGQDRLHPSQCGRAKRLKPQPISHTPCCARASRQGELALTSDLVGRAVQVWFKQARRLQSYVHAIRAGKDSLDAVTYRVELWSSILHAKGFSPSFPEWWLTQDFAALLGSLPLSPPDVRAAEEFFRAFQHAFRQFERWHLTNKDKLIRAKYESSYQAIFSELRDPAPDQIDCLWTSTSYRVLAVKPQSNAVLLDHPVEEIPSAKWFRNGCEVHIRTFVEEMVVFETWPQLEPEDVLVQHTHTKNDAEVHSALIHLWKARWQDSRMLSDVDWNRVTSFVRAFMPTFPFVVEDLQPDEWLRTVRRLSKTAARGADGYSKLDLLNMSSYHLELLLRFFNDIERGVRTWPLQFYESIVLGLAKQIGAHEAGHFRPIVLFSMLYRIWGSLRCRQLLRQLERYAHSDALGFMPGRETLQAWLQVQSAVELSLQAGMPLAGFQVNNHLSGATWSSVGFAEGDPLSVAAMALLDWSLHVYQDHMTRGLRTISFVDNISLLSRDLGKLVQGFFALQAFLQLWGLVTDVGKSYAWSTSPGWRSVLRPLGLQVVDDASELGGTLSLCASTRVRLFLQRGQHLERKWTRLRVSKAPLRQKLAVLPMVFWSSALHGALGIVFADHHIHELRKKAIGHLRLRVGGCNPLLRLGLSEPATADPGYFQLRHCIFDLRRACFKTPDLLMQWKIYMGRFDGTKTAGPFYKILTQFGLLGWSIVDPPLFTDHDGCQHDLLLLPNSALDKLLHDGWLQWIAAQVSHRKTMVDLAGLDGDLTFFDRSQMTPAVLGRVMSLQSGAFMSSAQQSKFDSGKSRLCSICGVLDDQRHWFRCPRFAAVQTDFQGISNWIDDIPSCVAYHLLPPRNPFAASLKQYFLGLPDTTGQFCSAPATGTQHLFSDGSCFQQRLPSVNSAAWAVVNATTGLVTGHGLLPGLQQSSARAELTGVIATLRWTIAFQASVVLWCDSLFVVRGLQRLLSATWTEVTVQTENHDLWMIIHDLLEMIPVPNFQVAWVPSHLALENCEGSVEEWLCTWNNIVDSCAVTANQNRGNLFTDLCSQALQHHDLWLARLRRLRDYYVAVAEQEQSKTIVIDLTAATSPIDLSMQVGDVCLSEALPVNWRLQLQRCFEASSEMASFAVQIFELIFLFEEPADEFLCISFLELAIWMTHEKGLPVLVGDSHNGWRPRSYGSLLLKPTVAATVQMFRQTFTQALRFLGLSHFIQNRITRPEDDEFVKTEESC